MTANGAGDGALKKQIEQIIRESLHDEMDNFVKQFAEGNFYQNLAIDMEKGVAEMYHAINNFKAAIHENGLTDGSAEELISDASGQLDEIVKTTESATNQILDIAENNQDRTAQALALLKKMPPSDETDRIQQLIEPINFDFMTIMTACSFQDLTGQRVKKVVKLIKEIEEQVLSLLVKSGIKIKEKKAGKQDVEIEGKTKKAIEQLKGPNSEGANQGEVDSLIASLGF